MKKIGLISCVKEKESFATAAGELYKSHLFLYSKEYALKNYDMYFILSAKHGMVYPSRVIEPYNETLIGKSAEEKKQWASDIAYTIMKNYRPETTEFYIHAGKDYRKYLLPMLEEYGFKVYVPLQGLGIGQQLQFYKNISDNSLPS
jgi:hypothetical protein